MRHDPDALHGRWIKHKHGIWRFQPDTPPPPVRPRKPKPKPATRNVTLCECGCLNQIGEDCIACRAWAYRNEKLWNQTRPAILTHTNPCLTPTAHDTTPTSHPTRTQPTSMLA